MGDPAGHDGPDELSVVGLLGFLSELDSTRNPPVHDIAVEQLYALEGVALPAVPGVTLNGTSGAWLTVEYQSLPIAPLPPHEALLALPADIIAHVEPAITSVEAILDAHRGLGQWELEAMDVESVDGRHEQEAWAQAAHESATEWVSTVWSSWSAAYRDAETCRTLYRDLFAQQARLTTDRDSVEFVWGFGRVRWDAGRGVRVDAPLLTVPVEVELDNRTQSLHVRADGELEVQVDYLASLSLHDRPGLLATRDAVLEAGLDPWGGELTPLLRTLVRHVHLSGVVAGEGAGVADAPVVMPTWVLYMRRRRPKYQAFLAALTALYRGGAQVPPALQGIVGESRTRTGDARASTAPTDPLLLPLPANEEQLQILRMAQEPSGVVVQGPPGTGKTHTIANLISHYVAYGKRVLVLAEKERALREVGGKVPEGIRSLTVSVLGADEASRRQLGDSINAIQNRVTGLDRPAVDSEIARLTATLHRLDGDIASTTGDLLATRTLEVTPLEGAWPLPSPLSPQSAAGWLREHEGLYPRIPDRIAVTSPCPLGTDEFAELLRLATNINPDRAERALQQLPGLEALPVASELAAWHTTVATSEGYLAVAAERVREWSVLDATDSATLRSVLIRARGLAETIDVRADGWLARVGVQLSDPLLAPEWRGFLTDLDAARERIISLRRSLGAHDVKLPDVLDVDFATHIDKAAIVLADGGKLGLFARSARLTLESCTIDGKPAKTARDAQLIQTTLSVMASRRAITTRWSNQVAPLGGPVLDASQPEVAIREHMDVLRECIGLEAHWTELVDELDDLCFDVDPRPSAAEAAEVVAALEVLPARSSQRLAIQRITELASSLRGGSGAGGGGASGRGAPVLASLLADTVTAGATQQYAELRAEVASLHELRPQALRLRDLSHELRGASPIWAQQLLDDPALVSDPSLLPRAWVWRQLDAWVAGVLEAVEPSALQDRLHDLVIERRRTVGDLVTQRAWRRLADNLGTREHRGLQAYLQAVTRYGKTGGKYEARRAAEIRRAMDECKHAVPVWIMTSSRALASFAPEAEVPFDVLILDEASQASYTALPLLGLAKQVIVVGDDKQTSPENVGLDRSRVFELMDDHLRHVSGYRTLFDPDNSLYDVARQRFTNSVMLVEHFRCLPDIIRFSNTRFYNGEIQPLRDRPPVPGWQALGAVHVHDGYRSGDVNRPEAEAVVELLARLDQDPRYRGMSFGVVTLLSGGQAQLIDSLLLDRFSPERYRARDLQVGEASAFQGAERDVMVVSLVVATDPANPSKGPQAATTENHQRRLNVAASRAKEQMWIVYSVDPERFHPNDHRGALIRHCRDPHALDSGGADTLAKCDSDFERRVARAILGRGFRRLHAQYPVGSESRNYRIDLVIEGREGRLAVECDGERWHGPDRWHADHNRQQVLERAGWTFERIRGSAFYRDETTALAPLWERLVQLGITPGDDGDGTSTSGQAWDVRGGEWFDVDGRCLPLLAGAARDAAPAPVVVSPASAAGSAGGSRFPDLDVGAASGYVAEPSSGLDLVSSGLARRPWAGPELAAAPVTPSRPPSSAFPAVPPAAPTTATARRPVTNARDEILASAYRVMAGTGRQDFTAAAVLDELVNTGTPYAESTIRTMISSHLVMDGSLDRVGRGVFRIAPSGAPADSRHAQGGPAGEPPVRPAVTTTASTRVLAAESTSTTGAGGTCQGCGKSGLIANTMCRKCRNGRS